MMQAISAGALAVLVGTLGYKFGVLVGIPVSIVSLFVYCYSGLGAVRLPPQSVEAPNRKKKKGQTIPRMALGIKEIKKVPQPHVTTLYENFQNGVRISGDRPCLGHRPGPKDPYVTETYNEVNKRIKNFGSGLYHLGVKEQQRIGFYAKNCRGWVIGAEACNAYSLVSVAIYDTLGEENREYIVNQSDIRGIVSTGNLLKNICALSKSCPNLKYVIMLDGANDQQKKQAKDAGLELYSFEEVEEIGSKNFIEPIPPKPDDLAILMYTSGTTSRPKGVMISHRNVVAVIAGVVDVIPNLTKEDSYFSYLPLAHILERAAEACMFNQGASIGFYQGDIRKLTDDVSTWKPTIYAGVPKVYQRIMHTVNKKIADSPLPVRVLFSVAFHMKQKCLELGLPSGFLDKTIFKKVQLALGGRVRYLVSGGAPLSPDCHEFIRVCFGAPFSQGYGLIETCGGASATPHGMPYPYNRAGAPFTCCEIKLVSAGKYSVDSPVPQGEICIRGDNVTLGYYENKEKTDEVFITEEDGERWFHTGDVGQWNDDGTLSIIGRVKDIFKLDGGEYIAPERLETVYCQSKYLSNIFVYGDSNKSSVVAVAVPDAVAAKQWADKNGVNYSNVDEPNTPKEICDNEEFTKIVKEDLQSIAESAKLNRFEYVPAVTLVGTYWTPDTGLVTDAMKNKRDPLYAEYKDKIDAMYRKLGQ